MGPAPRRFELSKGMLKVTASNGSVIWDPQFEMLRVELMRNDPKGKLHKSYRTDNNHHTTNANNTPTKHNPTNRMIIDRVYVLRRRVRMRSPRHTNSCSML